MASYQAGAVVDPHKEESKKGGPEATSSVVKVAGGDMLWPSEVESSGWRSLDPTRWKTSNPDQAQHAVETEQSLPEIDLGEHNRTFTSNQGDRNTASNLSSTSPPRDTPPKKEERKIMRLEAEKREMETTSPRRSDRERLVKPQEESSTSSETERLGRALEATEVLKEVLKGLKLEAESRKNVTAIEMRTQQERLAELQDDISLANAQIMGLHGEIKGKDTEIKNLEDKVKKLDARSEEKTKELEGLRLALKSETRERDQVSQQVEQHKEQVKKLKLQVTELDNRQNRVSKLEEQLKVSQLEAKQNRLQLTEKVEELARKTEESENDQQKLADLADKLLHSKEEVQRHQKHATELEEEVKRLEDKATGAEQQQQETSALRKQVQELTAKIEKQRGDFELDINGYHLGEIQLKAQIQELTSEVAINKQHREKSLSLEREIEELTAKAAEHNNKEEVVAIQTEKVEKLLLVIETHQQKELDYEERRQDQQRVIEDYRQKVLGLENDLERVNRRIETDSRKYQKEAANLTAKVNIFTKDIGEHVLRQKQDAVEIKNLRVEAARRLNQVTELEKQVPQLTNKSERQLKTQSDNHSMEVLTITREVNALKQEVDQERQHAKGFQEQVKKLGHDIKQREKTEDKYKRELSNIRELLDQKERELEKQHGYMVDLRNNLTGVSKERESLQERYELLNQGKEVNSKLEKELKESRDEIIQLKTQIEKQEEFVIIAQEDAIEKLEIKATEETQTVEDEELEGIFQVEIQERSKKWAYKYAIPRFDEDSISLDPLLQAEISNIAGEEKDAKAVCRKYDPDIIVNALVGQYIADNILKKPFMLFELEGGKDFAAKMTKSYETRLTSDRTAANKWRQQEIQWLEAMMPREHSESPAGDNAPITVDEAKCTELAKVFLNGPAKSLLKANANNGLQDLVTIIKQAIRVGAVMWRQPLDIQVRGYQDLKGRRFSIDDKEVQTHPSQLHPARLPSEDAVMDIVIQPSFVVRQNEQAEKVWCQAVVLWH